MSVYDTGNKTPKGLTQLDMGGVLRNSHSIKAEALRTVDIDNLVEGFYNRVNVSYTDGSATGATAFYDKEVEIFDVTFPNDVGGSLNSKYWLLNSAIDETEYYVWYNVSGGGTDPSIAGKTGVEVVLQTNDSSVIVQMATKLALNSISDFIIKGTGSTLNIQNTEPGETTDPVDANAGITLNIINQGVTEEVKTFVLDPVAEAKYLYNEYEKTFELYANTDFHSDFVTTTFTGDKALRVQGEFSLTVDPNNNNEIISTYNEITAVVASALTTVATFTAPVGKTTYLQWCSAGGNNIASFQVEINGTTIDKRRTYFGSALTTDFEFKGSAESGIELAVGDVVRIRVIHERPMVGDFEGRIQVLQVG